MFDLDVMRQIPFGIAYLATIVFKPMALTVLALLAVRMSIALKTASVPVPTGGSAAMMADETGILTRAKIAVRTAPLLRLAVANVTVGLFLAIDIVLAIYLHYISHLAVFLPS